MEDRVESTKQSSSKELPSLRKHVTSGTVTGSDSIADDSGLSCHVPSTTVPSPRGDPTLSKGSGNTEKDYEVNVIGAPSAKATALKHEPHIPHSFFIGMPTSPSGLHIEQIKRVMFTENAEKDGINGQSSHPINYTFVNIEEPKDGKLHSQPVQIGNSPGKVGVDGVAHRVEIQQRVPRSDSVRDKRFDSFKTLSGRFERQLSTLRGKPREPDLEAERSQSSGSDSVPEVDRYFAALEGPELDTLRASEELALPEDQLWPFLLRFPISSFGMCLGVSSQAMLWKTLATAPSMRFLNVSLTVNLVLWCISLVLMGIVSLTYTLKIIFYFETVRREYYHPIRVNFFFAPWIACLFLLSGVPPSIAENRPAALWYVLMAPIFCLELKLYGQWMSGGKRRLSKVANPSNHLSIVGNFVGALLGASMGLKEGPIFFFAVGLAHYIVLFVTLYQRLPTNETLPKDLHPVFFLFVAAPSVACMAWAKICGEFGYGSKIAYFVALFLYASLAVRINFFRGFRFSLAWWAYTFPMTAASIATIRYTDVVNNVLTRSLAVTLSSVATFTVTALLVTTIFHAFVLRNLFPNDISIAITRKRLKLGKGRKPLKSVSLDSESRKPMNLDIEDNELSISIDPRQIPLRS